MKAHADFWYKQKYKDTHSPRLVQKQTRDAMMHVMTNIVHGFSRHVNQLNLEFIMIFILIQLWLMIEKLCVPMSNNLTKYH